MEDTRPRLNVGNGARQLERIVETDSHLNYEDKTSAASCLNVCFANPFCCRPSDPKRAYEWHSGFLVPCATCDPDGCVDVCCCFCGILFPVLIMGDEELVDENLCGDVQSCCSGKALWQTLYVVVVSACYWPILLPLNVSFEP